ncbi:MAG: ribosome small subunit-dependent GTPase A [Cytophagales bacterium]|nr:ribosome small subunit-dependent GTPase A [Rhizobacter sp.]
MIEMDVERLRSVGLTPAMALVAICSQPVPETDETEATGAPRCLVRVTEVHRETLQVHDGQHESSARVLPRLARSLLDQDTAVAVGDWVVLVRDPHGQAWVHERIAPLTHIARRDADGRRHPVVSNVDTALLVMGLDDDFNPRRLERFLALVQGQGVTPVVVLTKADVVTPDRVDAAIAELRTRIAPQVEVVAVNGTQPATTRVLDPYLEPGQTVVLLGSSGAGKSTLTNALAGAALQDTGAVREHDSRGKHTTTSRSLHRLPGGACVIDTPGLRTLRPDADESTLTASFEDIASLAIHCRFRDCRHGDEPGCAVREGVSPDRLRNYQKLLREVRRDTLTVLERQQITSEWKARGRAANLRLKMKRGEV